MRTRRRPPGSEGLELGAREKAGLSLLEEAELRRTLAMVDKEWPRFAAALRGAGWAEAAWRLDSVGGARVSLRCAPSN